MEKEKKNKISLTVLVVFILIGVFGVLLMVSSVMEEKKIGEMNSVIVLNQVVEPIIENSNIINQIEAPIVTENMENSFSFEFLKMENNKSNMIYSPLSIKYALAMLSEGANGNTKTQIDNVIGRLNLTKYKNNDKILSLANSVFIKDEYSQFVKENFKDNLVQRSKMILINALAIDMEWANTFDDNDTWGNPFYLENGEQINATTMNKETSSEDISYYKDDNITAITMDLKEYDNTQLEFMAMMPEKNLDEYIKTITLKDVEEITSKLEKASNTKNGVDVSIPKFEFNYELKLKEDLQKLGITDAFSSEKADFTNMAETSLYVGEAIHKADVKFSEDGIRAAAVTVFAMFENALPTEEEQPIRIKIDKPFMFLIKDKKTGEIWFVGTVYEPNLWENDKAEYSKY